MTSTLGNPTLWQAPTLPPYARLTSTIRLPGSKSLTARWMILAALARRTTRLVGALDSADTRTMAHALEQLGARVYWNLDACVIKPFPRTSTGKIIIRGGVRIHAGQAGTVMRFILPLAAMARGPVEIDCADNARHRPIDGLVTALRDLGVHITSTQPQSANGPLAFPFVVHGKGHLAGGTVAVDAQASSQYISALLLAGALMENGLTVHLKHHLLPSTPHVNMSVEVLAECGISVVVGDHSWHVEPVPHADLILPQTLTIEPDLSNAGPFLVAAMVSGGDVTIDNWPTQSNQPGMAYLDLLHQAGATFTERTAGKLTCRGPATIAPLSADMHDVGELVPSIAALCAYADGQSHLTNIGHLRGHETDRLHAITQTLAHVGIPAVATTDALIIQGNPRALHAGDLDSYADHRMATCGAILGLRVPGIRVANMEATAKTFPQFVSMWETMVMNG
ncbi:3-phosphoshikimate 1-carboxyvinyltransferase [Arcanobacterium buesumense]|uniref:3-phosphoshikimate 1-carboxyvinyltransferase n=1 Tax=Arcanobacterium buesumense TaxID=2722751 RepID=A0A6H2EKD3_9ACTO|nr:3-phosphoshikimate 1-carboxyvinyltransferase [Arcanobacterium buesumense]QJC21339.1 3-phosphoshikimate 1-carboxyvinyltransferase [Arcanobacterium buesumense]